MRRFFETAARALRARHEMAVAITTAAVAAILIIGGQGNLAAVVALGAAGFMAGRACRYRLAARDARLQAEELREELTESDNYLSLLSRLAQERETELSTLKSNLKQLAVESRWALDRYRNSPSEDKSVVAEFEFLIKNIELLTICSLSEQIQLADLVPEKEEVGELCDTTAEE